MAEIELTEYIAPDGAILKFNKFTSFMMTEQSLGMPPISYVTQKGPFQHGETYLGFSLEPRIIQMLIRSNGCSREEYWANRNNLLSLLRPGRGSGQIGTLRKVLPDGTMRDISVMVDQGPVFGPRSLDQWDEWGFQDTIRFIAFDPVFFDPEQKTGVSNLATLNSLIFYNSVSGASYTGLQFSNPDIAQDNSNLVFGSNTGYSTFTCTNAGTWFSFPIIDVAGPCDGFQIINLQTGDEIKVTYHLLAGSTIRIDTTYGNKQVYIVETGENLIGTLTDNSDLTTFRLEPDPIAPLGVNQIYVTLAGATGTTSVTVSWYDRYIGI